MTVIIGQLDVIAPDPQPPGPDAPRAEREEPGQGPRVVDVARALEREASRRRRVEPD